MNDVSTYFNVPCDETPPSPPPPDDSCEVRCYKDGEEYDCVPKSKVDVTRISPIQIEPVDQSIA